MVCCSVAGLETEEPEEEVTFQETELKLFQSIDELVPGCYYKLRSKNFESVDALRIGGRDKCDELFQMNISGQTVLR